MLVKLSPGLDFINILDLSISRILLNTRITQGQNKICRKFIGVVAIGSLMLVKLIVAMLNVGSPD